MRVSSFSDDRRGIPAQGRWQVENLQNGGANAFTGNPWLMDQCLQFANFRTQYCMSLYWAFTTMTTVGYGDVLPTTNIDR